MQQDNGLYKKIIMNHYRTPHNYRAPQQWIAKESLDNPMCGDKITLYKLAKDPLQLAFEGDGCSLSIASASIMTKLLNKENLVDATQIVTRVLALFEGGRDPELLEQYEDLLALTPVIDSPGRIQCVLLAWRCCLKMLA